MKKSVIIRVIAIVVVVVSMAAIAEEAIKKYLNTYAIEELALVDDTELGQAIVYVTASGERFHVSETCARTGAEVALGQAINDGKTACGRCCKKINETLQDRYEAIGAAFTVEDEPAEEEAE